MLTGIIPSLAKESYNFSEIINPVSIGKQADGITGFKRKSSFGVPGVDLTGIKTVSLTANVTLGGPINGQVFAVKTDDPVTGDAIGYIVITEEGTGKKYSASVKPTEGTHDVYFYALSTKISDTAVVVSDISFGKEEYVSDKEEKKVPDSFVKDVYSDTWTATDDLGRAVADYAEAGGVKGGRTVGMMYWNWFTRPTASTEALVISDVIKANPDADGNYAHSAWSNTAAYYWAEPLLGFYDSYDRWVYKQHAKMLSYAGVDVIFFDYSNSGQTYVKSLNILADAFREAKKEGVKVPKICAMTSLNDDGENAFRGLTALYFNCFVENDFSDIWYYLDSKPLLFGNSNVKNALKDVEAGNESEKALLSEIGEFFTFRSKGERNGYDTDGIVDDKKWAWLENFPQILRNPDETGRPEFMSVGTAINQSTIFGLTKTGVASDPYSKGRGYSEAFGEDYSEIGPRMAYFFREQASFALENDPEFILIDGWNEWWATRNISFNGWNNAFIDTFDDENSRDFEPTRGALGDDYYNLLADFVRKYKGVRPLPLASGAKTIDINGDLSQWDGVGPEFLTYAPDRERSSTGYLKADKSANNVYTTSAGNSVILSKVSYDENYIYFMAQCRDAIDESTKGFMNLYINSDRNHATGWQGYDYAVNLGGKGVISKNSGNAWSWENAGTAEMKITGNTLLLKAEKSALGLAGNMDFEFKWTDSVTPDGDLLAFYWDGSAAPYGRFNYRYSVSADPVLTAEQKNALKNTTVLKAGSTRMAVSGAMMNVYEPDTSVAPFEMNGTLYIPEEAFNECLGYGKSKTEYNTSYNVIKAYRYTVSEDLESIGSYTWCYSVVGSYEAKINGRAKALSAPVIATGGRIWFPVSYISDCFGINVENLGGGVYLIGESSPQANNAAAIM